MMAQATGPSKPDTIVMIHGLWMTPRSWEHWQERYEARGYTVHAPAWPGFEVEVEALNADPSPMNDLGAEAVPPNSPDEFAKFIAENIDKWTQLIKHAGIKPHLAQPGGGHQRAHRAIV